MTVARTSHDLSRPLEYWDGRRWAPDAEAAANVVPRRAADGRPRNVNPSQVTRIGTQWVAVTKDADWWGDTIYLDVASSPTGPFRAATVLDTAVANPDANNYSANIVATSTSELVVGLSHNRWDGQRSDVYRPTLISVPITVLTTPNRVNVS